MKPLLCLLSAPLLALALSGCGTAGVANPDLVVYNDSTQVIYTITLSTETQSESVSSPRDLGLLERGIATAFPWMVGPAPSPWS